MYFLGDLILRIIALPEEHVFLKEKIMMQNKHFISDFF